MKIFKRIFSILFYLGLGLLFVYLGIKDITSEQFSEIKIYFKSIHISLIVFIFIVLFFAHFIRALRWKLLINSLGYSTTALNTFFATMIGYLVNSGVPRLGEIVKCSIITKYDKVPFNKLVGTIIIERFIDVISLLLVFILAFIFQYDVLLNGLKEFSSFFSKDSDSFLGNKIILIIISVVVLILLILYKKIKKNKNKIIELFVGFKQGFNSLSNLKNKKLFIIYSLAIWTLYVFGIYIGILTIQSDFTPSISIALSALAFSSVGVIITPGGIGTFPLLIAKILTLNGYSYTIAFANGNIQWIMQFLIILILGLISFIFLPIVNNTKNVKSNI